MISLNNFILLQNRLQNLSSIPAEAHMYMPLSLFPETVEAVCEAVTVAEAEAAAASATATMLASSRVREAIGASQVGLPDMSSLSLTA